nr:EOG090X08PR [Eulimnadia texana]
MGKTKSKLVISQTPASSAEMASSVALENAVKRLETVAGKLESLLLSNQSGSAGSTACVEEESLSADVAAYDELLQTAFAAYLQASKTIGGDVAKHAELVDKAFKIQRSFLVVASRSKQPAQDVLMKLLKPTSDEIQNIQTFREKNRTSPLFNHLSAISESIPALGWVAVAPAPAPFIKEMNDAGQFYTNRVLKDWKEKEKTHVDWVRAWIQVLTDLQAFVKKFHTTGLVWNPKGDYYRGDALANSSKSTSAAAPAGVPPPPPGPPPPPMPTADFSAAAAAADAAEQARSQLFAQLNKGEDITKGLKKVTSDMQTHKNPNLRTGPAPFKPSVAPKPGATPAAAAPAPAATKAVDRPARLVLDGKKWLVEYQKNQSGLVVSNTEMNQAVYIYKCEGSTVQVKGKVNSVLLDSCKKTAVVVESVVSSVEFVNCQSVQMQVLGKVPTINIDKTDGCQMYLSPDSLDVEIVSAKSSEMNVLVPKANGDYAEFPIPEQFKTTYNGKGLTTVMTDNV